MWIFYLSFHDRFHSFFSFFSVSIVFSFTNQIKIHFQHLFFLPFLCAVVYDVFVSCCCLECSSGISISNLNAKTCEKNIENLPNLIILKLTENKLIRIPIFHGLILLETLVLSNNRISRINLTALEALPKLTQLDLSRNMIKTIGHNTFPKRKMLFKACEYTRKYFRM